MRRLAIINGLYCRGTGNTRAGSLAGRLKDDLDPDMAFTEYPGHAEEIARGSSGYDLIIAAGGDGTISETVNGMDLDRQALAILPAGTGNSLARDLGIRTMRQAFDTITRDRRREIDLVRCEFENGKGRLNRYLVTTSGLGFASAAAGFGNRHLKMAGPFCYLLSACVKMVGQDLISAGVEIDGMPPDEAKFTNLFVNNTGHAANARVFPGGDPGDSALDMLCARTNGLTQFLWNISVITGTYFYYPGHRAAKQLRIKLGSPSPFMLDGEIFDSVTDIRYSVIPRALSILA